MHIFRWLMKHPIIILALYFLSIVAILLSMTGGGSDSDVAITATDKTETSEVDLSEAPAIEPSTLTSALVNEEPKIENTETQAIDDRGESETEISEPSTPTSASVNEEAKSENTEAQAMDDGGESETELTESTIEETAPQAASSTEQDQANTQFDEMNEEELLLMAREAYWNNGLEESAQIYEQLIGLNPEAIDYKGELGNVYWRQGFPKKAAELYSVISIPMIEAGEAERVANMVGFIGLFFPEKATEIHNKLQANK